MEASHGSAQYSCLITKLDLQVVDVLHCPASPGRTARVSCYAKNRVVCRGCLSPATVRWLHAHRSSRRNGAGSDRWFQGLNRGLSLPIECLYHVNSGRAPSYPGGQSTSTAVEAPITTSLSKDDTVVQAAMGDRLTGAVFPVMFTNETETASCFYPLKAHASSFTTRVLVLVEGRTVRSADNDRSPFSTRPTNSRKSSLMECNRSD